MIKIEIGTTEFQLPTGWKDVTLGQVIVLNKNKEKIKTDHILMLSIITTRHDQNGQFNIGDADKPGTPYHSWMYADAVMVEQNVLPYLEFITTPIDLEQQPLLDYLHHANGTKWKVPRDLKTITYGQKILAGQMISRTQLKDELMPELLALILTEENHYPKFDANKYEKNIPFILNLPAVEAFPAFSFFLRTLLALPLSGVIDVSFLKRNHTNRQTDGNSQNSGSTARFIIWLKETYSEWMQYWRSQWKR